MSKFRKVFTEFWDDGWMENQSPETRYFMLFLMTNPMTTQLGIYEISIKKMEFYTGYNRESVLSILQRLIDAEKVKYDFDNRELLIMNWAKYNLRISGKPVFDCLNKELENVENLHWLEYLKMPSNGKGINELLNAWYESSTHRGQEEEKEEEEEQEKEKERRSVSFGKSRTEKAKEMILEKNEDYDFTEKEYRHLKYLLRRLHEKEKKFREKKKMQPPSDNEVVQMLEQIIDNLPDWAQNSWDLGMIDNNFNKFVKHMKSGKKSKQSKSQFMQELYDELQNMDYD